MEEKQRDEYHLRIATSHLIAGALFYGMEIEEIHKIVSDVLEDYKDKFNEKI